MCLKFERKLLTLKNIIQKCGKHFKSIDIDRCCGCCYETTSLKALKALNEFLNVRNKTEKKLEHIFEENSKFYNHIKALILFSVI